MLPDSFDPFAFFEGRTTGRAVITDPFGRVMRRCTIITEGEASDEFNALHFDESYVYDDGTPDDVLHWAVSRNGTAIEAAEPSVVGRPTSRLDGPYWSVDFRRHLAPPSNGPIVLYRAGFCRLDHGLVMKTVAIKLFGVTVARLRGFHQRA